MDYLCQHEIPVYHVNTGNVVVDNGVCRITDYENNLVELTPKYAKFLRSHFEKVNPGVIAFGLILYEVFKLKFKLKMTVGYEMDHVILDDIPKTCPSKVKKVIFMLQISRF